MIGSPEATENGIMVRCYCNPAIKVGYSIQIDNKLVNQTLVKEQGMASWQAQYYPASTSADGLYRVLVIEHVGDSRGNSWERNLPAVHRQIAGEPHLEYRKARLRAGERMMCKGRENPGAHFKGTRNTCLRNVSRHLSI
jgi:hypothetical protein